MEAFTDRAKELIEERSWVDVKELIKKLENKMEATTVCWGYIGIMKKKMETTLANLSLPDYGNLT